LHSRGEKNDETKDEELSAITFAPTAQGQQSTKIFRSDIGVVTLGTGQVLRVSVIVDFAPNHVRFAWTKYMPSGCNADGVCRHAIESQGATTPVTVDPNETVTFDVQGTGAPVRVVVESSSRRTRVLGIVFDTSTQRVVAIMHPFGDF
jgi:hypothetical protein